MPNKPELQPTLTPGDRGALQSTLLAIGRFLQRPPGIASVSYDAAPTVYIRVTNRVGQSNSGRWVVMFYRMTGAGAITALTAPVATQGIALSTLPGGTSYLGVTDTEGRLTFTLGAALASGDQLFALVLGEPSSYLMP